LFFLLGYLALVFAWVLSTCFLLGCLALYFCLGT